MSTRTFTLDRVRAAVREHLTGIVGNPGRVWAGIEAALLKATPEAPAAKAEAPLDLNEPRRPSSPYGCGCSGRGLHSYDPLYCEAAKAEAKMCERCFGSGQVKVGQPVAGTQYTEPCAACAAPVPVSNAEFIAALAEGRYVNPAPVTPSPWLPMGQHPGGACQLGCGTRFGRKSISACNDFVDIGDECYCVHAGGDDRIACCTAYCADRAKGRRDMAQDSVADAGPLTTVQAAKPKPTTPDADQTPAARDAVPSPSGVVGRGAVRADEKPAPVAGQPGVPEGYVLGDGWTVEPDAFWGCSAPIGRTAAVGHIPGADAVFVRREDGKGACLPCAVDMHAIVPVEPSRKDQDGMGLRSGVPAVQGQAGRRVPSDDKSGPAHEATAQGTHPRREEPGEASGGVTPDQWEAEGPSEYGDRIRPAEPSRPLAHRADLPVHEREISATSLEMLAAGIEEAKAGKLTPVPAPALEEREPSRPGTGEAVKCAICDKEREGHALEPFHPFAVEIAPPAPSNHPGPGGATASVMCLAPDLCGKRWRRGDLLTDGDDGSPPYRCPNCAAPGKPDEAPLSEKLAPWLDGRLPLVSLDLRVLKEKLAALEAKLARAERRQRAAELERDDFRQKRDDLRAQVATRDARIAGLEASSADLVRRAQEAEHDRDFAREQLLNAAEETRDAVTAERGRCLAWWDAWVCEQVRDAKTAYEGIARAGRPRHR